MARQPKPWYRKERKSWFVTINGKRHNLGPDKKEATCSFFKLVAHPSRANDITFFDLLDEFLEWTSIHRAKQTYKFYQERITRFTSENPDVRCSELRPYVIQRWLDGKDWGKTYKAGVVSTLKRCCNWAVRQGLLDSNPIKHLEKPPAGHRDTPVTLEEYEILLKNVPPTDAFRDVLIFLWETGARPQEAFRFTRAHIDWKNKRVRIENPKSKGPKWRTIHLTREALAATRRQPTSEGPVFKNSRNQAWTTNACSHRLARLSSKVGRVIAPYDFRHAFATELLKAEVDPITVAQLMGHTDVRMLMETYQHVAQDSNYIQNQLGKRRKNPAT